MRNRIKQQQKRATKQRDKRRALAAQTKAASKAAGAQKSDSKPSKKSGANANPLAQALAARASKSDKAQAAGSSTKPFVTEYMKAFGTQFPCTKCFAILGSSEKAFIPCRMGHNAHCSTALGWADAKTNSEIASSFYAKGGAALDLFEAIGNEQ